MSTDALALAQLELLYRLGVLERERPTSSAPSDSSSRQHHHQSQSRAVANAQQPARDGSDDVELRSVSAAHPHSFAIKHLNGDADYNNYGRSSIRKPLYTSPRAQAYSSVHMSPRHRERHPVEPRQMPRHPAQTTRTERLHKRQREHARMWFLYWKLFVRNARKKRNVRAISRFHVKKRVMRRWKCLLWYQKRIVTQKKMLHEWKAVRLARKWHMWATKHRRIQLLLENTRFALVNRLRRRRVWLRWLRFAAQSRNWNVILDKQVKIRNMRRLRSAWLELKVFVCRARQTKRGLDKIFQALQRYREMTESKRRSLHCKRMVIQRNAVRRLLCRWRQLAVRRNSTHRLQRQVEFGISRPRYLMIWRECLSDSRCIAELRARQGLNSKLRHLFAWSFAVKALRMARERSIWAYKATRKRYFRDWKQETTLARQCQLAFQEFERFQLLKALGRLRLVVAERRRLCQIADHWRSRTLKRVWRLGFLKFHQQHQKMRAEQKILETQAQRSLFAQWVEYQRVQIQNRALRRIAVEFSLRNRVRRRFALWKQLWRRRKLDYQQLARGDQFHRSRLMLKGVFKISALVAQKNENAETGLRIRRQCRLLMKARVLRAWTRWAQHKRHEHNQVVQFQARERYQRSWFNLNHRMWSSWREFTASQTRNKQANAVFHHTLKRKCLHEWHRRARTTRSGFIFQQLQSIKTLETTFANWRSRTSHWQKIREVFALAETVYRRKNCGRILRGWAHWACKSAKVKLRHESLEQIASLRMLTASFQVWTAQYQLRAKALRFAAQRQTQLRTQCLREWHQYVTKHIRLRRKLGYFQQVFGNYPTTSLVQRVWLHWTRYTSTSLGVKSLCRRQQCRQMRTLWKKWTFFHLYTQVFREWHRVAGQSALESHEFGKRLRQFYASRRDMLKSRVIRQWKAVYRWKQTKREMLKIVKHRVLRAIVSRSLQHSQARSKYMRKWFSRWHQGIFVRCDAAKHYYEAKLARKMLIVWWRVMVNAKQELVLSEAKQVLGSLSFYHPQQKLYTQIVKEKALAMRAASDLKREPKPREVKMKKMRRMLDPEEKPMYASYRYQEPRRARHDFAHGEQQTRTVKTCRVGFQARDLHVVKEMNTMNYRPHGGGKEPTRLRSTHQDARNFKHEDEEAQYSSQQCSNPRLVLTAEPTLEETYVSPRPDTDYRMQHQKQSADSRSGESVDYYQQIHPNVIRQPEALPLFDPQTPPRPPKTINSSRLDNSNDTTNLRQHDDILPDHHEQLVFFKTRATTDRHELPLYDEIMNHRSARPSLASIERPRLRSAIMVGLHSPHNSVQGSESPPPAPPQSPHHPHQRPQLIQSTTTQAMAYDGEISLEQLASMEVFETSSGSREEPRMLASAHLSPPSQPSILTSSFASEPRRLRGNVNKTRKPQISSEPLSLSAILELPAKSSQLTGNQERNTEAPPAVASNSIDPSGDILSEILTHYAQLLVEVVAQDTASRTNFKTRRQQICFRVLRDLGLFHNQFYFPQMDSVMESISTEHFVIVHERLEAPIDKDDREYLSQLEGEYLKRFLIKVVEIHPLYTQYRASSDATSSGNRSSRFRDSSIDQTGLQWLVHVHLQARGFAKSASRHQHHGKPFWVKSPLPSEVESALPKLLLCISKYFKVLAQLFSTTRASQKQPSNAHQQLAKSEFTQLLKHVHVFPQLLNRREAESAFEASCCSCCDQKELSFPEFVEALVRCSTSLQWGEAAKSKTTDGGDNSDTGVVVKFLMLLFAMEGRGSVLQRRNEDLQVVVGYLEQQQAQQKTGRMARFRKLLADQKRDGTRSERTGQQLHSHHRHRHQSTWMSSELNSGRSTTNSRSPARGRDDGNLFSCAAESGGGSNRVYDQEGERLFDLGLLGRSQGFLCLANDLLPAADKGGDDPELNDHHELASPPDTRDWREGFLHLPVREDILRYAELQRAHLTASVDVVDVGDYALPAEDCEHSSLHTGVEVTQSKAMTTPAADHGITDTKTGRENEEGAISEEASYNGLYRVGELQDTDEFLDEILSSIGDVELVLQQSNLQLHRQQTHDIATRASTSTELVSTPPQRKTKSVDEYSDDFESESADNVTANIMRTLFTDASYGCLLHQIERDESLLLLDQVEDVRVNDPMLNQLTDMERFTDSAGLFVFHSFCCLHFAPHSLFAAKLIDWRAYPTLENIAELGVHAVSPTSLYRVTPVQVVCCFPHRPERMPGLTLASHYSRIRI